MVIDTQKLEIQDRVEYILYSSPDVIIYYKNNQIITASCSGEILSSIPAPIDYTKYEFLDFPDVVLFLFNGSDFCILDKNGIDPIRYSLNPIRTGKCITPLFHGNSENSVIFGTKVDNRIQFVNYNFISQNRIVQTASWKVANITDSAITFDFNLYAVLDESTIICCDMITGETIWTKFETAKVNKGITVQSGYLVYTCQNLIKKTAGKETTIIRIPLIDVTFVEHSNDRNLYLSYQNKNLCCYNTVSETLMWEIHGNHRIKESLVIQDKEGSDILVVNADTYLSFVNLTLGKVEKTVRIGSGFRLRKTGNHILIQKNIGSSSIVGEMIENNN